MIEKHGDRFGVEPICRVLGYPSASTYYARRGRPSSARAARDEQLLAEIARVRAGFAGVYGARRTWVALRRAGVQVARCTVERIMRVHGLVGVQRGRKPRTTTPDAAAARPGDLVKRQFVAEAPNQLWLSDITYLPTEADFGLAPSVGTVGDSFDNAMAEALNGTFKAEIFAVFGGFDTRPAAEVATYEWVSWYNHVRIHTELGDMPPAEYEAQYHAAPGQRFVTTPGNETPGGVSHGPM